jgi:glycosyltransferase involved in cell wall biosynthesis
MKVVVLGAKGLPGVRGSGGVERGVNEVARRLVSAGHEVIVYERARCFGTRREDGVIVRSVPYIDRKNLAGWSHVVVSLIDSLVHDRQAAVYHLHGAPNGVFSLPLRLLTRAKVILHLHGAEWRTNKWSRPMAAAIWLSCLIGALGAHEVASVCAHCLKVLSATRFLRHKLWFVPNGLPSRNLDQSCKAGKLPSGLSNSEGPFILYAGRLVPQKGVDLLIRALKTIEPRIRLLIVGPESHCDRYVTYLKELAANDSRIAFVDQVDFATLGELYRRSLALVLPSYFEGCSNVLLEALACGSCIVASDIPENQAVVGEAAALFRAGDLDSLREVLNRIVVDSSENARLRGAARSRSQTLADWDIVTRDFLRLYAKVPRTQSTWTRVLGRGATGRSPQQVLPKVNQSIDLQCQRELSLRDLTRCRSHPGRQLGILEQPLEGIGETHRVGRRHQNPTDSIFH